MFKFAANKLAGTGSASAGSHSAPSSSAAAAAATATTSSVSTSGAVVVSRHGGESAAAAASHQVPVMMMAADSSSSSASARRRCQIQKDLFAYNKIADKGFPSKPSAMDYDRKLKLLAIGTKNGDLRVYGEPGTLHQQLSCYQDVHPFPVLRLLFVQGTHQLITLSERTYRNDATNKGESNLFLVLWQIPNLAQLEHSTGIGSNLIEKVKDYQLEPKIVNNTRLSALALLNDNSHLFIGFESGDVYVFNVSSFQMVPGVINKDYILKNLPAPASPEQKKLTSLGAVESISHHPRLLTKLLIAYQRGLWIIFDFIKNQIEQINQTQQQLESAVFYQHGECVATAHSDGSFILWDLSSATPIQSTSSSSEQHASTSSSSATTTPTTCSSSSAPNIVYGPYPCKAVNKCVVKTCRADQPYVIFSGGCPRVNYSDKITITVIQGEQSHVCFDFTSKIIEFFTVDKPSIEKTQSSNAAATTAGSASTTTTTIVYDNPQALFVLLEEEFVAIDLVSEGWPQYKLPYLCSVHSSAIICTHYANSVSRAFYDKLVKYGASSNSMLEPGELFSDRDWPISSSSAAASSNLALVSSSSDKRDLLLTGHEDGSVRFWDVTNMSMSLIYRLKTSDYFQTDSTPIGGGDAEPGSSEDNWPPFRKVGTFDPYSDDPKLGVQKIQLCARRELIVVAGTAGQVLLMSLNDQPVELPFANIVAHKINIIGSSPEIEAHFVWKGHDGLLTRGRFDDFTSTANNTRQASTSLSSPVKVEGSMKLAPGFQLHTLVQLYPPATVSALALNTDWQLIGVGTSYGFALFDFNHTRELLVRCTLDPAASANMGESGAAAGTSSTISRRKSLKKSLRESFRKLRRGRSQKPGAKKSSAVNGGCESAPSTQTGMTSRQLLGDDDLGDAAMHRPIERQVESREFKPVDDIPASVIRFIYFVRTHITSNQQQTNSMWVGTNTGIIYIYALQFVANSALVPKPISNGTSAAAGTLVRTNQTINCLLAKEMRLKHRAPVVHIQVIDQNMQPLPLDLTDGGTNNVSSSVVGGVDQQPAPAASGSQHHKVIICSEEQFKVFQLPTLKPVCKFKLTAVEGARVRRIGYTNYVSRQDARYHEHCLSCLSNLGDISVYSLPSLKRQVQIQCMKQQDINAITSFVFSKQGQAFYLQSASEFVHISMSARDSPPTHSQLVQAQRQQQQQQQHSTTNQSPLKEARQVAKKQASQEKPPSNLKSATSNNSTAPPPTTTTTTAANTNTTTTSPTQAPTSTTTPTTTKTSTSSPPTTVSPTAAEQPVSNGELGSPKSPPPPVPAPRTTIASLKDDSNRSVPIDAAVSPTASSKQAQPTKEDLTTTTTTTTNKNSKEIDEITKNDNDAAKKQESEEMDESPVKKRQPVPVQPRAAISNTTGGGDEDNVDLNSTSPLSVPSATMLLHSTSTLNQSAMATLMSAAANNTNPAIANCSMSTGGDSFNVSSSGYNGSSTNGTFNLSMDSVVDKFSDEFSQLKIPSSIDEDATVATAANDSLLNESNSAPAAPPPVPTNRLITTTTTTTTNGHHSHLSNGKTNGGYEAKRASTNGTNGHFNGHGENGHVNGGANVTDDETTSVTSAVANTSIVDMVGPQKASSPLAKMMTNGQNGHHSVPLNVTKRIENGNKLEYRETAID